MLILEQLTDGNYRLTFDRNAERYTMHMEWTFARVESDAEPAEGGEVLRIEYDE